MSEERWLDEIDFDAGNVVRLLGVQSEGETREERRDLPSQGQGVAPLGTGDDLRALARVHRAIGDLDALRIGIYIALDEWLRPFGFAAGVTLGQVIEGIPPDGRDRDDVRRLLVLMAALDLFQDVANALSDGSLDDQLDGATEWALSHEIPVVDSGEEE